MLLVGVRQIPYPMHTGRWCTVNAVRFVLVVGVRETPYPTCWWLLYGNHRTLHAGRRRTVSAEPYLFGWCTVTSVPYMLVVGVRQAPYPTSFSYVKRCRLVHVGGRCTVRAVPYVLSIGIRYPSYPTCWWWLVYQHVCCWCTVSPIRYLLLVIIR